MIFRRNLKISEKSDDLNSRVGHAPPAPPATTPLLFTKFDLGKFPYCLKSSYGRLLSRKPTNPYITIEKQVWYYYSGRSCLAKVKSQEIWSPSSGLVRILPSRYKLNPTLNGCNCRYLLLYEARYVHRHNGITRPRTSRTGP